MGRGRKFTFIRVAVRVSLKAFNIYKKEKIYS